MYSLACRFRAVAFAAILVPLPLMQAQDSNPDTTFFDKDGTARMTRVIPVPKTVSSEAQVLLATGASWAPAPNEPLAKELIERARKMYPVKEKRKR